jgi:hypothetical protein
MLENEMVMYLYLRCHALLISVLVFAVCNVQADTRGGGGVVTQDGVHQTLNDRLW